MLLLKGLQAFASGGNRLCYIHPSHPDRCIKVFRPDRTPTHRRNEKGLIQRMRPLSKFDENHTEEQMLRYLHENYPGQVCRHLPHSYGIEMTDMGPGHSSTVFRDSDGLISLTLEQFIYKNGLNDPISQAINTFFNDWKSRPPPTRDLIPHNIVAQTKGDSAIVLYLIDGFGRPPKFRELPTALFKAQFLRRRKLNFDARIAKILERRQTDELPEERLNNLKRKL